MYHETIKKVLNTVPHDTVKLRHYGETARPSVPFPNMKLTEDVEKGKDAAVWLEMLENKGKKTLLMLVSVEIDG